MDRERTSEEVLYPLLTLYPHVAALQMQSNANTDYFSCYQNVGYWADAYSAQSVAEESKASSCRSSGELSSLWLTLLDSTLTWIQSKVPQKVVSFPKSDDS